MNQTARKIQDILESAYKDVNFIDFVREIFPSVVIFEPIQFHKEFSNFSVLPHLLVSALLIVH